MTAEPVKARYVVHVDDNFHFMDEGARWKYGEYTDAEAALAACRHVVELCLEEAYRPGMTVEALISAYRMFGDDPFIVPTNGAAPCEFSAWSYAEERARNICAASDAV